MANSLASGQKPTGVADLDSSQTLENKTLDSTSTVNGSDVIAASIQSPVRADVKKDTLANLQTYALTASNGQLCFATDAKKMYQVLDAALAEVGSGQGGINYISNPDFELNADGYTNDVNLTIARSTVAPLRGDASGVISKAAVDASGEVVKIPFTIESADLAKKLYISFDKDASDPNYADGDLRVEVIKDPNGTPVTIRCNAEDILGGKGSHLAWFQTDASILEYELVFKCNSSNASAYSVKIDNISVGPREVSYGSAMTDLKDNGNIMIPSTGAFGTTSINEILEGRIGDKLELYINVVQTSAGTSGSGTYIFDLPNNLSFSEKIVTSTTTTNVTTATPIGRFSIGTGDTDFTGYGTIYAYDQNSFWFHIDGAISDSGTGGTSSADPWGSTSLALGSYTSFSLKAYLLAPIQGWSSNSIQSEDIGNREVRVRGAGNGGESITASVTDVPFTTITDTTGSWDGSVFTAPETGNYSVTGSIRTSSGVTNNAINFYIDGTISDLVGYSSNISLAIWAFSGTAYLQKGQTLSVRFTTGGTLSNTPTQHHIEINKLASPQTILETETVAARYTSDSGQSIGASATDLEYEDIDYDTHNAYNISTGVYTVPVNGIYDICASLLTSTTTLGNGDGNQISIVKNGSVVKSSIERGSGVSATWYVEVNDKLKLEKGDLIKIQASNANSASMSTATSYNVFSIARIK